MNPRRRRSRTWTRILMPRTLPIWIEPFTFAIWAEETADSIAAARAAFQAPSQFRATILFVTGVSVTASDRRTGPGVLRIDLSSLAPRRPAPVALEPWRGSTEGIHRVGLWSGTALAFALLHD